MNTERVREGATTDEHEEHRARRKVIKEEEEKKMRRNPPPELGREWGRRWSATGVSKRFFFCFTNLKEEKKNKKLSMCCIFSCLFDRNVMSLVEVLLSLALRSGGVSNTLCVCLSYLST